MLLIFEILNEYKAYLYLGINEHIVLYIISDVDIILELSLNNLVLVQSSKSILKQIEMSMTSLM